MSDDPKGLKEEGPREDEDRFRGIRVSNHSFVTGILGGFFVG
jgi:hypothetical protein